MIKLSRILTVILCCAPAFAYGAGPVATTSGSNLTAYNPSTAYNNQWATISNARYDGDTNARVDFGNCNAVVLRCAQPKCANGGCTDASVAGAIVSGCVKANDSCKKYGDDLVSYMTAQLVANSTAKVQEQQMALEQAKIQAEAQAQAVAAASNAQNEQMMAQMQSQMQQMQQQMAQQQEESNRQLQEALAQQAAQGAAAVASMKTAATEAAQQTEAGITSYQQEAINRGISEDVLARQQITGQIMTEIENADLKLKEVKTAMQNSFEYAKCDARGNNCGAPKRIKKWRELASGFLEPYDETLNKIYDALITAEMAGVDLSQIYAMLSDACNSWSQYLCPGMGDGWYVRYGYDINGGGFKQDAPRVCYGQTSVNESGWQACRPCTWVKNITKDDDIYQGYVNADMEAKSNQTVAACAGNALEGNKLFSRLSRKKKGDGIVNIDILERWLHQVEPDAKTQPEKTVYCGVDYNGSFVENGKTYLETSVSSMIVPANGTALCVKLLGSLNATKEDEDCPYINRIYAICDTHPYNANLKNVEKEGDPNTIDTENQEKMNEIIGLKITVISQQMYKQYEYLRATLQRLKIQLEKSVLTSNLEAAGAKSDSSSSGGGLLGGGTNKDSAVVLSGAINCSYQVDFDRFVDCISGNIQSIIRAADSADKKNACVQLQWDLNSVVSRLTSEGISATNKDNWVNCKTYMTFDNQNNFKEVNTGKQCTTNGNDTNKIKMCANEIISKLSAAKRTLNNQNKSLKELLGSI